MITRFQAAQGDLHIQEVTDHIGHFEDYENGETFGMTVVTDGVIAHGESGHTHRIKNIAAVQVIALSLGFMMVKVLKETELVHEEHGPIPLEEGCTYEIRRQREVDLIGQVNFVRD